MNMDRRAILQLLAQGRIDPAQAERLLAISGADREDLWVLAGCVAIAILAQLQYIAPWIVHLLRAGLAGNLAALHHALTSLPISFGGMP
jgi:hypothetical protein